MQVYVINLDKNSERLANMTESLLRLGVPFERFPAVYGRELSKGEKTSAVNRFAWWCAEGYPIRDGQLGCALSHLKIYQQMIDLNLPYCCILEDDVIFENQFPDVLNQVGSRIEKDRPQVILLHCHFSGEEPQSSAFELKRIKYERCAESYVITRSAAQRILELNYPIRKPCDHWGWFVRKGVIELYQAFPTVCAQDWTEGHTSDVYTGNCVDVRNFNAIERILWYIKRIAGKMLGVLCGI